MENMDIPNLDIWNKFDDLPWPPADLSQLVNEFEESSFDDFFHNENLLNNSYEESDNLDHISKDGRQESALMWNISGDDLLISGCSKKFSHVHFDHSYSQIDSNELTKELVFNTKHILKRKLDNNHPTKKGLSL